MSDRTSATLVAPTPDAFDQARIAAAGFLAGYKPTTREGHAFDLRQWGAWCADHDIDVLTDVRRQHIELWGRHMLEVRGLALSTVAKRLSTIRAFYRYCHDEDLIDRDPAARVRRPKLTGESSNLGMDRDELIAFVTTAERLGRREHAMACLLAYNGLRVSELCGTNVEALGRQRGHRTLDIVGKGDKQAQLPLAPRTVRALDLYIDGRFEGPIFLRADGQRMDRHTAGRIVRRIAKHAGITHNVGPHSCRHGFITAALDAGVPIRDVQIAARHSDPSTTTRYDRNRRNLDRHATYVVASFLAGGQ